MKSILVTLLLCISTLGATAYMSDADAKKRLGGGKSTGTQKESIQRDATPPPAKAAAPAAAPAAGAAPAAAAPVAASGASKWLGPLAGLAAGGLLAAMFMGGAFDGLKFFDILLMIGLAVAAFMLVRMFMRKKAAEMGGMKSPAAGNSQYAGASAPYTPQTQAPSPVSAAPASATTTNRIAAPEIGSRLFTANASAEVINDATAKPRIPADFDVVPFERNSKAAFIRLQAANDAKDLNDIREFATPEMYGELALQIQERGTATQKTEVVSVDARVIEVVIENNRALASVRYTGVIREDDGQAEGFDEVWHVSKDLSDEQSTWRLAGIQQLN